MLKFPQLKSAALLLTAFLAGCGGGGGDDSSTAKTPTAPTSNTPARESNAGSTPTTTNVPPLSAAPISLTAGMTLGRSNVWPDGDAATGGQGKSLAGVDCATTVDYHIHAHLAIFRNGEMLAVPEFIGLPPNCTYELHTHDASGIIHIEGSASKRFTLGQFFAIWGQPLSTTNVAGITDLPVVAYINDGTNVTQYTGNLADIELTPHRSITLQIGSALQEVPSYNWAATE